MLAERPEGFMPISRFLDRVAQVLGRAADLDPSRLGPPPQPERDAWVASFSSERTRNRGTRPLDSARFLD